MNDSKLELCDDRIATTVDLRCYRISAIKKSAYRIAERCTVILGEQQDNHLGIAFTFPQRVEDDVARDVVREFFQDLLDQELREQVAEETAPLRALILAQAFSRTDLIQRD